MFAPCGEGRFVKYIKPVVILGERLPVTNDEYIQMCMCKNVPLQDTEHTDEYETSVSIEATCATKGTTKYKCKD